MDIMEFLVFIFRISRFSGEDLVLEFLLVFFVYVEFLFRKLSWGRREEEII